MRSASIPTMLPTSDPLSLIALLVGRDNSFFLYIMIVMMLISKRDDIQHAWKQIWTPKYNTMQFTGQITRKVGGGRPYANFEENMRAIVHYVCKHITAEQLNTMATGEVLAGLNNDDAFPTPPLPVNTSTGIKITADIEMLLHSKSQSTSREHKPQSREPEVHEHEEKQLLLVLRTKKPMTLLTEFVRNAQTEYSAYTDTLTYKPRIIKPTPMGRRGEGLTIAFETTKTFENLFFEGKEALMSRLEAFKHKDRYIRMGLPHTLGLLFYGEPGTGKTSCIKAIAHYMQMTIVLVPMNKIVNRAQLEDIFLEKYINGEKIPHNKRMYVLEEVDCNGWADIIKPRGSATVPQPQSQPQQQQQSPPQQTIILQSTKDKYKDNDDEEKLTLGAILEILDGIVETSGRIVIMTTNNPAALDPALRRPGRIDMELEFKKLRRQHIASIYERWYGRPMKEATMNRLPDYRWTQADIGRLLFKHETNASNFIDELLR